jgi:hypothetical protein
LARENQDAIQDVLQYQIRYRIEIETRKHLETELKEFEQLYISEKAKNSSLNKRLSELQEQVN